MSNTNWMAQIADSKLLSELSIPGTHDSGARFSSKKQEEWQRDIDAAIGEVHTDGGVVDLLFNSVGGLVKGIAKEGAKLIGGAVDDVTGLAAICQNKTISQQLDDGIRFLDIRIRNHGDQFRIFHGDVYQHQSFDEVLADCVRFLTDHPRECILMSIKEDKDPENPSMSLEDRFAAYVAQTASFWYLQKTVPTLGAARGKIVFFRRFGLNPKPPTGIDAAVPYNSAAENDLGDGFHFKIQDCFDLDASKIDTKWAQVQGWLAKAAADADPKALYLNFTSAVGGLGPVPIPMSVARVINPRLLEDLRNRGGRRVGIVAMDFPDPAIIDAIIGRNA